MQNNKGVALLFKKTRVKSVWNYSLYTLGESGDMTDVSGLQLEGREMIDYKLRFTASDELIAYATITNKGAVAEKRVHGSWFAKFDADMKLGAAKYSDWDVSVLTEVGGERLAGKKEPMLKNFNLKDVLFREDGNMLVLLEEMRAEKDMITGATPIRYNYKWTYGGVLTLGLNPASGEPEEGVIDMNRLEMINSKVDTLMSHMGVKKKPLNVLSLFNGMNVCAMSLEDAGIEVNTQYISEIDKYANQASDLLFPNAIQLGSVCNWESWDIDWSSIDLVTGGFPCQAWSMAGKQLGDKDVAVPVAVDKNVLVPRSQGDGIFSSEIRINCSRFFGGDGEEKIEI